MDFGVTALLDDPFYTGPAQAAAASVPFLFPVAIGGHGYLIEPTLYERQTIARLRPTTDTSTGTGQQSLSTAGLWSAFSRRWDHGAGQEYWDRPESDPARFRQSKGVDPWGTEMRLLAGTRLILDSAETNLRLLQTDEYLYAIDGTTVSFTADPTLTTVTWSDSDIQDGSGDPEDVEDFTSDGTSVYAACGTDGVFVTVIGAVSSTAFSVEQAHLIEYANGWLLIGELNVLSSLDTGGSPTVVKTHPNAGFTWATIAGAPNGIYVGGNAGDKSEIYYVGLETNGALAVPTFAGALPDGENIRCMSFYGGLMLLGTSRGLRLASIGAQNGLSHGPLIEIPGGVEALEPQGEFCWFSWSNYDDDSTGLGRARLSVFTTEVLVPAYASDLMAGTADSPISGTTGDVATFGERRYFAVEGSGIWAETGSLLASGRLDNGQVGFGTIEKKIVTFVDVHHEPLQGQVNVRITLDNNVELNIGTSAIQSSLTPKSPFTVPDAKTEEFEVSVLLARSNADSTLGPAFERWTLRGIVTPARFDQWAVPLILRSYVDVSRGEGQTQPLPFNVRDEYQFLKAIEALGGPTVYQEGIDSHFVTIEQIILPRDENRIWSDDRTALEGIYVVQMTAITENPTSTGSFSPPPDDLPTAPIFQGEWEYTTPLDAEHGVVFGPFEGYGHAVTDDDQSIYYLIAGNDTYTRLDSPYDEWFTMWPNNQVGQFSESWAQGTTLISFGDGGSGGQRYHKELDPGVLNTDGTTGPWEDENGATFTSPAAPVYGSWQSLIQGFDEFPLAYLASAKDSTGRVWMIGNRLDGTNGDPRLALAIGAGYYDEGAKWIRVADLPAGAGSDYTIEGHSACCDRLDQVYIGGGSNTTVVENRFRRYTPGDPVAATTIEVQHVVCAEDNTTVAPPRIAFTSLPTFDQADNQAAMQAYYNTVLGTGIVTVVGTGADHTVTWVVAGVQPLLVRAAGTDVTITRTTPGGGYPSDDTWDELALIPDDGGNLFRGVMVADTDNRIYYIGGTDGTDPVSTVYRWTADDTTGTWETLEPLPTGWSTTTLFSSSGDSRPGFVIDNQIVVFVYKTDETATGAVVYDITTGHWRDVKVCNQNHLDGGFAIAGGYAWAFSGSDGSMLTSTVERILL